MVPPCFEHNALAFCSSLSAITGAPLPPTLERFRDKAQRCISRYISAPHTARQLSVERENVTSSYRSILILQIILTQKILFVNDFGKKSFTIVTNKLYCQNLGVKRLITFYANFKEIGCVSVGKPLFIAFKKHGVSFVLR